MKCPECYRDVFPATWGGRALLLDPVPYCYRPAADDLPVPHEPVHLLMNSFIEHRYVCVLE